MRENFTKIFIVTSMILASVRNQNVNEILKISVVPGFNSHRLQLRSGSAGYESSCSVVKHRLPGSVRRLLAPDSKEFYTKYTEAYRIPVMSYHSVPDAALKRACYVLRFLLADRSDLRQAFYSKGVRVVVLGKNEFVHDLPEFRFLKEFSDNDHVSQMKTFPANDAIPIAVAPEENLLCHEASRTYAGSLHRRHHHVHPFRGNGQRQRHQDNEPPGKLLPVSRNMPDDVFLKTLAVSILNIAVKDLNPELRHRLDRAYDHAMASGWWTDTESTVGPESYFGEGVQSFYDANAYSNPPDGFNNDINLRTKLRSYDTALYAIVHQVFPCANSYQTRCSSRGNEAHLHFEMECRIPHWQ